MLHNFLSGFLRHSQRVSYLFGLAILFTVIGIIYLQFQVSQKSILVIFGTVTYSATCFLLGRKSIFPIFFLVFILGYFQGLAELLFELPIDLGIIKYALLYGGGLLVFIRLIHSKHFSINRGIFYFFLLSLLFFVLFLVRLILPSGTGVDLGDLIRNTASLWGMLNIPLVFMIFADLKCLDSVYKFLRILVWLGIFAALLGLVQYVLGSDRLLALGIDIYSMSFVFLNEAQSTLLRVFSVFPSHYEFASFMVVSILSKLILHLHSQRWLGFKSILIFLILLGGLFVTFNVTLWLALLGMVAIMLLKWEGRGFQSLKSKKTIHFALTGSITGILTLIFIPAIRNRLLGAFTITSTTVADTAGKSLYYRSLIIRNLLNLIREFPLGLGPNIRMRIAQLHDQRGWFLVTGDSHFLWLALMGGIIIVISYLCLYIQPLWYSYKYRHRIPFIDQPLFWGIRSFLLIGILFGGISNGALLTGTPTNLLVWASIGVLLKMASWKTYNMSKAK